MDTEFSIFDLVSLRNVIERCKKDPSFSKKFYKHIEELVKPVYYSIMKGSADRAEFLEMLNECIEDLYMFVLSHSKIVYTNFESFIRKRFEFYILNKCSAYNSCYNRYKSPYDEANEIGVKEDFDGAIYVGETIDSIVDFMNNHREDFSINDKIIVVFYSEGYNLNEISQLVGRSYGKIKSDFESIIFKLKNHFYSKTIK